MNNRTHRRESTRHRKGTVGVAAALCAVLLAACGSGSDTDADAPSGTDVAVCAGVSGPSSLAEPADRIISLSSTATEMLYAIGAGEQVFAVDNFSNHPAEAAAKTPKLDGFEPNVEAIAGYEPDLVVISYDPGALAEQLCGLGIAVWMGAPASALADVYDQIADLGALTGRAAEAGEVVESMRDEIAAAAESVEADLDGATYYFELGTGYYALTSATVQGEILELFGMSSIADEGAAAGAGSQELNAEAIIAADPDVIFLANVNIEGQTPEVVAARPGWSSMTAVADASRMVALDDDVASRWGPRLSELATAIASALADLG